MTAGCRLNVTYLIQRVCIGLVADAKVMFKLPEGPHAHPAVFLSDRQQQRSDRIVELRNSHWIPGAQEHNVCTTRDTERQNMVHQKEFFMLVYPEFHENSIPLKSMM